MTKFKIFKEKFLFCGNYILKCWQVTKTCYNNGQKERLCLIIDKCRRQKLCKRAQKSRRCSITCNGIQLQPLRVSEHLGFYYQNQMALSVHMCFIKHTDNFVRRANQLIKKLLAIFVVVEKTEQFLEKTIDKIKKEYWPFLLLRKWSSAWKKPSTCLK